MSPEDAEGIGREFAEVAHAAPIHNYAASPKDLPPGTSRVLADGTLRISLAVFRAIGLFHFDKTKFYSDLHDHALAVSLVFVEARPDGGHAPVRHDHALAEAICRGVFGPALSLAWAEPPTDENPKKLASDLWQYRLFVGGMSALGWRTPLVEVPAPARHRRWADRLA
jgi:hypothetical protein